jgi:hypothetical protein
MTDDTPNNRRFDLMVDGGRGTTPIVTDITAALDAAEQDTPSEWPRELTLDTQQTAELLGVTRKDVHRMIKRREFPSVEPFVGGTTTTGRPGGRKFFYRIPASEVEALAERRAGRRLEDAEQVRARLRGIICDLQIMMDDLGDWATR